MDHVFSVLAQRVLVPGPRLWKLPRRGNRGKRTACFPPFPLCLENSAKDGRVSHSSHNLYCWSLIGRLEQKIPVDMNLMKA